MGAERAEAPCEPEPPYDVVVLGAGLAGLGAARTLAVFGHRTVVVEARERVGGRAHTAEFPAVPELGLEACPVEEGCNYLHGCEEDNVLFVIARCLGLPTAVCPSDLGGRHGGWESQEVCEWRDAERGGERIPTQEVLDAYFLLNHVLQGVACVLPEPERGGPQGMDSHAAFEESLRALLPRLAAAGVRSNGELSARERGLLYSMRGRLLGYVAPAARMPAAPLAAELGGRDHCEPMFLDACWPGERFSEEVSSAVRQRLAAVSSLGPGGPPAEVACSGRGEDRLLLGAGFRAVVEALASGLEVLRGDPATLVQQGPQDVSVRLASGRALRGRLAVVALPTGVLAGLDGRSAVEFEPPLPAEKLECIRNLSIPHRGAATHEKVVLRWGPSAPIVAELLGAPGASLQFGTTDRRFHFLNLHRYGRAGQLLCHIWADAEWRQHGELSDEEVVAEVVAALRAMFPGRATADGAAGEALVGDPSQWTVTRWAQDPFALGAYSELQRPGAREGDRQVYSRTEGRVLFAGEGAVPAEAGAQCTHGALLSGASAAVEAMVRLHSAGSEEPPSPDAFPAADLLLDGGLLGLNVGRVAEVLLDSLGARAPPERKRKRHS